MSILYFNEWGMRIKIYYKKINKKDLTNHLEYCILILHAKTGSEKSLYLMDGQDPPGFVCLEIENFERRILCLQSTS